MAEKRTYGVRRDIKAITGSSGKHTAKIEGLYPGIFPSVEMPVTHDDRRMKKNKPTSTEVRDISIRIDLDAKEILEDENFIESMLSVVGLNPKDADFDVLSVTEKVLRALSKAKFRNLAELKLNDALVYDHPELEYDMRNVLDEIGDLWLKKERIDSANARVIDGPEMEAEAYVKVDRSRKPFTHDIRIDIHGNIEKEYLRRIVNYLEENLEIDRLFEKDIFSFL